MSLAADSEEEVDAVLKRVSELGGIVLPGHSQKFEWGSSGYFEDPEGHNWEIVYFVE
ncbi:VOC family protein [Atopococcus tabaci]|uniref:VOC family protein n=1 Tax=Atopococcus tabaci TaxID=269774 RepID=UPI0003F54957|nr:VOC family protein [Atopococcus tabaci]